MEGQDDRADRPAGVRRLRFDIDYGARSPLWTEGGRRGISLMSLSLSESLRTRLRGWCEDYDANYRWDTGWASEVAQRAFLANGKALLVDVRTELGAGFIVDSPLLEPPTDQ